MELTSNNNQVNDIEVNDELPIATKVFNNEDTLIIWEPVDHRIDVRTFENVYVQNTSYNYIAFRQNNKYIFSCLKLGFSLIICTLYVFLILRLF